MYYPIHMHFIINIVLGFVNHCINRDTRGFIYFTQHFFFSIFFFIIEIMSAQDTVSVVFRKES